MPTCDAMNLWVSCHLPLFVSFRLLSNVPLFPILYVSLSLSLLPSANVCCKNKPTKKQKRFSPPTNNINLLLAQSPIPAMTLLFCSLQKHLKTMPTRSDN